MNKQTVFADRQYVNDELKDMFFKLDLIQSYGSGIRRAKKAMVANGSPKLAFRPNNDTDDYTLAVAYVNEEFARIQKEEEVKKVKAQESAQESTQENAQENMTEITIESKIIRMIIERPVVTRNELAKELGISPDNVKYRLNKLRKLGIIKHQGSTKAG